MVLTLKGETAFLNLAGERHSADAFAGYL
jgi:hypothetical protein